MLPGKVNDRRLEEVLEIVELRSHEKLTFRKYSLGMKQRLGIAAALLTDPELVLLDEPTNGLDPAGVIEIRRLIQRLSSLGKTIFLSSHILYEVQQVCNRVAILQKGNLVKQGKVSDLLRHSEQVEVRLNREDETHHALNLLQQRRVKDANWISGVHIETNKQGQSTLLIDAPTSRSAEINALLAQHNLFAAELHPREGSLEEVFLELTTPSSSANQYSGMEALAEPLQTAPSSEIPGMGKRGSV
jgi:ABC-2 type transport system ATP-binding protein